MIDESVPHIHMKKKMIEPQKKKHEEDDVIIRYTTEDHSTKLQKWEKKKKERKQRRQFYQRKKTIYHIQLGRSNISELQASGLDLVPEEEGGLPLEFIERASHDAAVRVLPQQHRHLLFRGVVENYKITIKDSVCISRDVE